MTGGQFSPLSGPGINASTAPDANIDPAFDVVELAKAAGATFAARNHGLSQVSNHPFINRYLVHRGSRSETD